MHGLRGQRGVEGKPLGVLLYIRCRAVEANSFGRLPEYAESRRIELFGGMFRLLRDELHLRSMMSR